MDDVRNLESLLEQISGLEEDIEVFPDKELLRNILDCGHGPEDFLNDYESKLHVAESRAISDYIAEADNFLQLSVNIKQCDEQLQSLEEVLSQYDASLSTTSSEIARLQSESERMRQTLDSKRRLQKKIGSFVERIVLLPSMIDDIMKAPVNNGEAFSRALVTLHEKLDYVAQHEEIRNSASYRDVAIEMERLRLAAVRRCRDFLLERIFEMRHPNSNIQVQQNVLIKYRQLLGFLKIYGSSMYGEIRINYVSIVMAKFLDIFKSYWASLEHMEETIVPPDLLLGSSVSGMMFQGLSSVVSLLGSLQKGANGSKAVGAQGSIDQHEVFELHDRLNVLQHLQDQPIVPSPNAQKRPFEYLFASISRLLEDTAAHEYLFCKNFWQAEGRGIFKEVFKPVVDFIQGSLNALFQEQNDLVSLLLCIKINRESFLGMSKRRNPALDEHFDAVNLLLWPRVKYILDRHLSSVQPPNYNGNDGVDLSPNKVLPLSKRYASMMASVLILSTQLVDGSIALNIDQLKYAVMNTLLTTSRQFSKRGEGTIFLLHNFSYVICHIKEKLEDVKLPEAQAEVPPNANLRTEDSAPPNPYSQVLESFEDAFHRSLDLYIESRLQAAVPQLRGFVQKGDMATARQVAISEALDAKVGEKIAQDFSNRWEKVIEMLNKEIRGDFSDPHLKNLVLKTAHSRLLLLWSQFMELMKQIAGDSEQVLSRSISIHSIMQALTTS